MYESFYGLSARPFDLTPDHRFVSDPRDLPAYTDDGYGYTNDAR
jgi:hypothetical protein